MNVVMLGLLELLHVMLKGADPGWTSGGSGAD